MPTPCQNCIGLQHDANGMNSTACAPLQEAIQYNNFSTTGGGYGYCSNWAGYQVPKCSACLTALDNGHYLNNYLVMLDAGCQQTPAVGSTISVAGNPFSTVPMNVTTPTPTLASIPAPNYGPISLGARVGIAFGALAGILALTGFCVVMNGKRRRRAFLKDLEKKHRAQGWPGPNGHFEGGQSQGELNQTPMSQRPLRGWDESPVSAGTPLPRYFSPYSSQYNSPSDGVPHNTNWPALAPQALNHVSEEHLAAHGQSPPPAFTTWPSATQEKLMQQMQLQHEQHEQRQQEMAIGIALGGTEPSLRSKNSSQQMNSDSEFERSPSKGKKRDDSYELQEVDSSPNGGGSVHSRSRPLTEQQAPVLQHPGFGRKHSNSSRHGVYVHGGLTEEDARRGNAL